MSNSFDFELVADDRATAAIDEINEAIKTCSLNWMRRRKSLIWAVMGQLIT